MIMERLENTSCFDAELRENRKRRLANLPPTEQKPVKSETKPIKILIIGGPHSPFI